MDGSGTTRRRQLTIALEMIDAIDVQIGPDQLAARIGGNWACVAIARKLLKRSYHVLRGLGEQALQPVTT
jgi:hypothetical protein